ncbi:MAG: outer membrane transport energization protein ExbB [Rhodobacteraceae bacterium HLUCCA08]|nr:MAG: outer membrane transport energization protein ExbB [Rhodobacteraceae bacterium HLUCCA08]
MEAMRDFLERGGPALWVIAALSVLTLALILWKTWRLARAGAWAGRVAEAAVAEWCRGAREAAQATAVTGRGVRAGVVRGALLAARTLPDAAAREETTRLARAALAGLRQGLRPLELIVTIAPLIGLLGTVLGMIDAFRALQDSGAAADPGVLAGGIWEALLTTAAGMAVAIPAAAALAWFEAVADRVQGDLEDLATRIFVHAGGSG